MLVTSPHIPSPSHLFSWNVLVGIFQLQAKKILSWRIQRTQNFLLEFLRNNRFFFFFPSFKFWQIKYIAVLWCNAGKTSCFSKCQRKRQVTLWAMLIVGSYKVRRLNVKLHFPEVISFLFPSQRANEGFSNIILVLNLVK